MRVALVHSFYSSRVPSGENNVVQAQAEVLRAAGHDVTVVAQMTDERLRRRSYPFEAAATAATGRGPSPAASLRRLAPDIVHVHNLFPNFGTRWLRGWPGPLVATMHNYRPLCPASTLFRDGRVCRDCPESGRTTSAVRHRCFHGSAVATLPLAVGTRFGRDPVLARADVVTTLSEGMSRVYADYGVASDKLTVLENFVADPSLDGPGGDYWLYAGRIEVEKGLPALLRTWPAGHRLLVAGDAEEGAALPTHPDVELLGRVTPERLLDLMAHALGLVFPSVWLEGLALVCLEALAVGTPILTFDDIPAGESVARLGVGLTARRDALPAAVEEATSSFPGLRERCRVAYHEHYTPEAWLERAEEVYRSAIRRSSSAPHG